MRKCPKCNKVIPMNELLYGVKKRPIVCPHCQNKFVYDFKSIFLLCGWWTIPVAIYFLYRIALGALEKMPVTNTDMVIIFGVMGLSFLLRFKFAKIKSID